MPDQRERHVYRADVANFFRLIGNDHGGDADQFSLLIDRHSARVAVTDDRSRFDPALFDVEIFIGRKPRDLIFNDGSRVPAHAGETCRWCAIARETVTIGNAWHDFLDY